VVTQLVFNMIFYMFTALSIRVYWQFSFLRNRQTVQNTKLEFCIVVEVLNVTRAVDFSHLACRRLERNNTCCIVKYGLNEHSGFMLYQM